jgi:hypothetical protein
MNSDAVVQIVQSCIQKRRYRVTRHFQERLEQRTFFWSDVLAIIDRPSRVRDDGLDDLGRDKWIFAGDSTHGVELEVVIVLDQDDKGDFSLFVTIYYA